MEDDFSIELKDCLLCWQQTLYNIIIIIALPVESAQCALLQHYVLDKAVNKFHITIGFMLEKVVNNIRAYMYTQYTCSATCMAFQSSMWATSKFYFGS